MFLKSTVKRILRFICSLLIPVRPGTVFILESSYPSGSNTHILYKRLKEAGRYRVDRIERGELFLKNKSFSEVLRVLKLVVRMSRYQLIVCSHGNEKYNNKQILIDVWHGIPLKAMRHMEPTAAERGLMEPNLDYLITTSKMHSVLMGATHHIPFTKHRILGYPRNDHLFAEMKEDVLNLQNYDKVLLYMPTFRQGYYLNRVEGKVYDNLFNFEHFSEEDFIRYLTEKNYLLILKLHPMEEKIFKEKYSKYQDRILFLTTEKLKELDMDLYQILPHTDLLITDYSSIYFDYLLLDKPMVFINADLEEYKANRGILLEPYDAWTPGYKAQNQESLVDAIERSFREDAFRQKRGELKEIFHQHQDGHATDRLMELIGQLMQKR